MSEEAITKDRTMQEILKAYPGAQRALFARYHIGGCSSCGFEPTETLERVCISHNLWVVDEVVIFLRGSQEADLKARLSPEGLVEVRKAGQKVEILDVRDPEEIQQARIEGARPLTDDLVREIVERWPKDAFIVLVDHSGERSMEGAGFLMSRGFTNIRVLDGGIDAWAAKVDPSMQRYATTPAHTK